MCSSSGGICGEDMDSTLWGSSYGPSSMHSCNKAGILALQSINKLSFSPRLEKEFESRVNSDFLLFACFGFILNLLQVLTRSNGKI